MEWRSTQTNLNAYRNIKIQHSGQEEVAGVVGCVNSQIDWGGILANQMWNRNTDLQEWHMESFRCYTPPMNETFFQNLTAAQYGVQVPLNNWPINVRDDEVANGLTSGEYPHQLFKLGNWGGQLCRIVKPSDRDWGRLYVIGTQRAGYAKVRLLDASDNSVIPDSQLPGNVAGFAPDLAVPGTQTYPAESFNMSNVEAEAVIIEIDGNYDGTSFLADSTSWRDYYPSAIHGAWISAVAPSSVFKPSGDGGGIILTPSGGSGGKIIPWN